MNTNNISRRSRIATLVMVHSDLPFLQSDRLIFKLYACDVHLKKIKNIKLQHGDLLSKDARISAEIEIDSLVSQMIGAFDSLLFRIIDKYQLSGIPSDRIEIDKVISVLSAESKRIELANELGKSNKEGNWYWMLKHLRNYSLHGSLLSEDASLDVIPYFEQTLGQLKEFVNDIKMKEPILQ
ncbi:MAG TPA: hypothetical protein VE544_13640 [Nitrososphaeraceae archaeon]|nr:hypothetical protein [Nitrososphaeraceae archaeon]